MNKEKENEFSFGGLSKETVLDTIRQNGLIPKKDFADFAVSALFVDAEYQILGQFLAEIKMPDFASDKYMEFVSPSPMVCWENRSERQIVVLDPGPHWKRNLLVASTEAGKPQPVIRQNFWVDIAYSRQTVLAFITVRKQINYHSNKETIMLDIQQCGEADPDEAIYEIGRGVKILDPLPDWAYQFIIPGSDRAIRFSKKRAAKSVAA